jgi:DNA-directed RNA polymerase specialized sigma24 family protein
MAEPGTSDAVLLARIDDPRAFEAFYRRHMQAVLRFATRRCRTPDEAAELVSVVFLEVRTAGRGYDGRRGPARPWLATVDGRVSDRRVYSAAVVPTTRPAP